MNGNDQFLASILTNSDTNTVKPHELPVTYQVAQGVHGGRGYLDSKGVVTYHDTVNGKMTVDKQHDGVKRGM